MDTILVPLDSSPRAPLVRDAAVTLARQLNTKLLLIRVIPNLHDVPTTVFTPPLSSLSDTMIKEAQEQMKTLASAVPEGLIAGWRVVQGVPWRAITEAARKEKVGTIVVGAHGHGGLESLGSTASKVVNHAPCNVLVVRTPEPT